MQNHGRVERHDVVALEDHRLEPACPDVVLEQHAVVAVVVCRAEAAVDLGRREHEAAPPAQRDDLLHGHGVDRHGARRYRRAATSSATTEAPCAATATCTRACSARVMSSSAVE